MGIKSIIRRDIREQEFARFFLFKELWVPNSGVEKVWSLTLDRPEIGLVPNDLPKNRVLFCSFQPVYMIAMLCS